MDLPRKQKIFIQKMLRKKFVKCRKQSRTKSRPDVLSPAFKVEIFTKSLLFQIKDRETPHMKTVLKNLVECMSVECCSMGRKRKKRSAPVCERTLAGDEKGFDTFTWSK